MRTARQRHIQVLARRLRVVSGLASHELRELALNAVREATESDAAAFYLVAQDDEGQAHIASWQDFGSDAGEICARNEEAALALEGHTRNLRHPPASHTSRFLITDQLGSREDLDQTRFGQTTWVQARLEDQVRLLAYDDEGQFLGWIGGLRFRGQPRYRRRTGAELAPLVEPVRRLLRAARAAEGAAMQAFLVVSPDGDVRFGSPAAQGWLSRPGFRDALAHMVRHRPSSDLPLPLRRAKVDMLELDGEEGPAMLVSLKPFRPLGRTADSVLSPAERRVAMLIADGATTKEAAATLGRSAETVRTQLQSAYAKLGVATRIELHRALN